MVPWDALVDDLGPAVYRTALRIVGQAADAEDVVQEVFLEVHRLWRSRHVDNWDGLLRTLAARRALDLLRKRKCEENLPDELFDPSGAGPEGIAAGHELQDLVRRSIARMPPQQAEVFSLFYLDHQSHPQIAASLGISTHAVAAALYKARESLAADLQNLLSSKAP